MQISVLFAYCSGRNFNDTDPPLLSKYGTRLILGCGIGPRSNEYLMSLRRIVNWCIILVSQLIIHVINCT